MGSHGVLCVCKTKTKPKQNNNTSKATSSKQSTEGQGMDTAEVGLNSGFLPSGVTLEKLLGLFAPQFPHHY